jgi:hypothetical protein
MPRDPHPPALDLREFTLCLMGHSAFQYVYAGLELRLFELLAGRPGMRREEVARALRLQYAPSRCLLLGLTALGFLHRSGGAYSNGPFVADLVRRNKLDLLTKFARFQARIAYPGQLDFLDSLTSNRNAGLRRLPGTGKDLYTRLGEDPALGAVFFDFMSAWSEESLPLLLDAVDFSDRRRLADVGGGDATIAVGLARAYPDLAVRILDIAPVCALAEERIRAHALSHRVEALPRDAFRDEFPPGCDCFLFAHFLVIWAPEENIVLLRKAHDALPRGGRVVIFNSIASDTEDGPLFAALDAAYFMAVPAPGGLIYSWKDYEDWLHEAGFADVRRVPCHSWLTPHGALVGVKG